MRVLGMTTPVIPARPSWSLEPLPKPAHNWAAEFDRTVRIDVTGIEPKRRTFRHLKVAHDPFGETVVARRGTLKRIDEFDSVPPSRHSTLSPLRPRPTQSTLLRLVLGEPAAEVFFFSDQAAPRHFGAVQTVDKRGVEPLPRA